jgi:hypothetical protein
MNYFLKITYWGSICFLLFLFIAPFFHSLYDPEYSPVQTEIYKYRVDDRYTIPLGNYERYYNEDGWNFIQTTRILRTTLTVLFIVAFLWSRKRIAANTT